MFAKVLIKSIEILQQIIVGLLRTCLMEKKHKIDDNVCMSIGVSNDEKYNSA